MQAGEPDDAGSSAAFSYHRSIAPMIWVFFALSATELIVVHALLSHWFPTAAIILSALTVAALAWLVVAIRTFKRLPVLITRDHLLIRTGRLKSYHLPLTDVLGLRESWTGEDVKARAVGNLALLAWPNVWIDLARPHGRRQVTALAHKLDDPVAFKAALQRRLVPMAPS